MLFLIFLNQTLRTFRGADEFFQDKDKDLVKFAKKDPIFCTQVKQK